MRETLKLRKTETLKWRPFAVVLLVLAFQLFSGPAFPDNFHYLRSGAFLKFASSAPAIQSLTNVQKLSLPANTPVGTQVSVSDGFVVSGAGVGANGLPLDDFYAPLQGVTFGGKQVYRAKTLASAGGLTNHVIYTGASWLFSDTPDDTGDYGQIAAEGNEDYPWQANWSVATPTVPTLTHPAVQELAAPSTAQGGVFVSGGTQDGIYTKRGTTAGKDYFNLLEAPNDLGFSEIFWGGGKWNITDADSEFAYYSTSVVATPDLASNWKNFSDNTPASITVTSVSLGELNAGVTVAGAGTATSNGGFVRNGTRLGFPKYSKDALGRDIKFNIFTAPFVVVGWSIDEPDIDSASYRAEVEEAFPWLPVWILDTGDLPVPTFTRNDVASEANWQLVP